VQLARTVHGAVLLVNGRSVVRIRSPAPRSERVSTLCGSRLVERMLLAGLSGSTPTAVTDGGGGVDEAPKSRRSARTPDSCGLISCWCRSGFWAGVAAIREASGCPMRQRVLAASSRGCCLPGARGAGGAGRREQLCARAQNYTRLAIRLRWCRITSRTRSWRMEMPSDQVADLPARVAQWIRASGSLCSAAAQPPVSERTIERS
jgi:hypothetical protein